MNEQPATTATQPLMRFQLLIGSHCQTENGILKTFHKGQIVESEMDLESCFAPGKFRRIDKPLSPAVQKKMDAMKRK